MAFLQLNVNCEKDRVDLLEEILFARGALSVSLLKQEDGLLVASESQQQPLPQHIQVQALFDEHTNAHSLEEALTSLLGTDSHPHIQKLGSKDWQKDFQQHFEPIVIGQTLGIYPNWDSKPPETKIHVKINPGLAFGTGSHPTTYLCLKVLTESSVSDKEVIDFGCGSGILAISAIKLGAKHAYAIDIDQDALANCKENCQINHIDNQKITLGSNDSQIHRKADILLANILLEPLLKLRDNLLALCKPNTTLILSGILENQQNSLIKAYEKYCKVSKILRKEEWITVIFKKN